MKIEQGEKKNKENDNEKDKLIAEMEIKMRLIREENERLKSKLCNAEGELTELINEKVTLIETIQKLDDELARKNRKTS